MEPDIELDLPELEYDAEAAKEILSYDTGYEQRQEERDKEKAASVQSDKEEAANLLDPREGGMWNAKAIIKEGQSILTGGLQDTASSIATFPERTVDAFSGERQQEIEEKGSYTPEWDPFNSYENPIITKTWWGKLARGVVHFGSMAAGIVAAVKTSPVTVPAAIKGMAGYSFLRAAGIGAVSDLISQESDGHNAMGALKERYPIFDNVLATKDTDHPIMMKLKNITEGMGIGMVFDGAFMLLGKGTHATRQAIKNRGESVEVNTLRKGIQELIRNEYGLRGSKNKPIVVGDSASGRGGELFVPNSSGQIIPNSRLGSGGGVNVNFNINAVDASGFEDLLVRSRGTITQLINNAVNEKGRSSII